MSKDGHPFAHHRQHAVEKRRASHITKGYASGGGVHSDEAQDRKLFHKMMKDHDHHAEGKKAKHRRDKVARAKGGRVGNRKGKGSTHVNVIVGHQTPTPPGMPAAPAMAMPPPAMPPGPPPGPPPGLGGGPGLPPGLPPGAGAGPPMRARGGPIESPKNMKPYAKGGKTCRARGGPISSDGPDAKPLTAKQLRAGRARGGPIEAPNREHMTYRAKGGGVKSGPAWDEGKKAGTPVQPSEALSVTKKNMNRGKVVSFATGGGVVSFRARGGPIESTKKVDPATKTMGGGGGGLGRRMKAKKYAYGKPMHGEDEAR
jgi:hypothetical protein